MTICHALFMKISDINSRMPVPISFPVLWKDHLALTIGRDLQGLTFHRHNAAWNLVVFGSKRWILYDGERIASNKTRLKRMTRDVNNPIQLSR